MTDNHTVGPVDPLTPNAADYAAAQQQLTVLDRDEWRRLHPATPLLKGGIALIAILGVVIANLRERIIDFFVGGPRGFGPEDIVVEVYERGQLGWVTLAIAGGLIIAITGFYLSWRMHSFRVTNDALEVKSGILFRTHRQARLDRIQGIAVNRPIFARLFGAAKLEVSVAGQDAKVQLAYLRSGEVDSIRRDILVLASQRTAQEAAAVPTAPGHDPRLLAGQPPVPAQQPYAPQQNPQQHASSGYSDLIGRRVSELLAPELDPNAAPPESVVRIPPGRLAASHLLSGSTVITLLIAAAAIVFIVVGHHLGLLFVLVPIAIGVVGYFFSKVSKSLRFSIAGTTDGVRVGYGLLSTSNDTLPPGRIHAVEVHQPLLWRPFGWWAVRINRAGHASSGSGAQPATTMLPVGTAADVERVLGLLIPGLAGDDTRQAVMRGLVARAGEGFSDAPSRAKWLRPLSWKRTGYSTSDDAVLLRKGFVWRQLTVVPAARIQSIRVEQGPIKRALRLSEITIHTVTGPVSPHLGVIDTGTAIAAFNDWSAMAVAAAGREDSPA